MKTRMRQSPKAKEPGSASTAPEDKQFHEIPIPIYRPLIQGERVLSTDLEPHFGSIQCVTSSDIGRFVKGSHLFLRRVTTVPLQIQIK